jgi:3-deoxy-D-manno-octulosonate 8-phosphate phosphatase (KDO 8-P phosphatase)
MTVSKRLEERANLIKLLVLDVDGVLTDGRIIMDDDGRETKSFDVKDGHGIRQLMAKGVEVALITGRKSRVVDHRARELGIREIHQGVTDKKALLKAIKRRKSLSEDDICAVGDDIPDLAMFSHAGLMVAVADAVPEVLASADYVTEKCGGRGAVREICELIIRAKNLRQNQSIQAS